METVIQKTIGLGDAGLPFDLIIDVVYDVKDNQILISECIERECPYDNPSEKWYRRIEDIVSDYFFDTHPAHIIKF